MVTNYVMMHSTIEVAPLTSAKVTSWGRGQYAVPASGVVNTRGGPTSECHLKCHLVINIPTYHVVEHFHLYSTGYETRPKISELQ